MSLGTWFHLEMLWRCLGLFHTPVDGRWRCVWGLGSIWRCLGSPHPPYLLFQKRRSNRQVKRKKYTEDLDIKITDDEEDEELDVTGPVRPEQPPVPQLPVPEPEPEGETLPSMQFFVVRTMASSPQKLSVVSTIIIITSFFIPFHPCYLIFSRKTPVRRTRPSWTRSSPCGW